MTIRSTEILPLTLMFPVLLNADRGAGNSRARPFVLPDIGDEYPVQKLMSGWPKTNDVGCRRLTLTFLL